MKNNQKRMLKWMSCMVLLGAMVLSFGGCSASQGETKAADSKDGITVTDTMGREIAIEKPLEKIVTYNSGLTDVLVMFGAEGTVIGRGDSVPNPDPSVDVPTVGKWNEPNIEAIMELKPEAVFTYAANMTPENEQLLESAGIKCIYLELTDVSKATEEVTALGALFGNEEKAAEFVKFHDKYAELIEKKLKNVKEEDKASIYYEGYTDYKSVNKDAGGQALIDAAGGINIAAAETAKYPEISDEWVLERNPDAIVKLVSSTKKIMGFDLTDEAPVKAFFDTLIARPSWSNLAAVKDGKVILLSSDVGTTALGSIIGELYLAKTMYPEQFKDVDVNKVHQELQTTLYGDDLVGIFAYPTKK